jgi:aminoglycoside phosphotransferase (APT) family kinase protein
LQALIQILEKKFNLTGWALSRPGLGHQKECFIAQTGSLKLFIKFGIDDPKPLWRLGEIGVAPPLLETGEIKGKSFFIQEYIEGKSPEKSWFGGHLTYLAAFIRRYHDDIPLTGLLSQGQAKTYRELIAGDIAELEKRYNRLKQVGKLSGIELENAFSKLKRDANILQAVKLVPVHAEPNNQNMVLAGERLVMVDWDEIRLGDPAQDIGLVLWWYVPPAKWAEFFESYGLDPGQNLLDRLYWWTARASLMIALWQFEHGYDGQEFLLDFQAAVNGQLNPHATFKF